MDINYIGEQLIWGKLGNLFIVLSFTASLLASVAYYFSMKNNDASWKAIGRSSFYLHSFSVVAIIGLLISLILRHRFEYYYVWEHSNTLMPFRYIFSCLWEGQEGSFLLW
ncbi:MAG: hypothetical protein RIQ47_1015, partial [Bacteroidota bacterium]